jgi:hypothetical protein
MFTSDRLYDFVPSPARECPAANIGALVMLLHPPSAEFCGHDETTDDSGMGAA